MATTPVTSSPSLVRWRTCVQEGDFYPRILPSQRWTSLELLEPILTFSACGVSTRAISWFLDGIYSAFCSLQSISRLTQVVEEEVRTWRECPLSKEYYAVFLDETFLSIRRGKSAKEPVYIALGIKPDGHQEILGFWLFGAEGKSAKNWERSERSLVVGHQERKDLCHR